MLSMSHLVPVTLHLTASWQHPSGTLSSEPSRVIQAAFDWFKAMTLGYALDKLSRVVHVASAYFASTDHRVCS
jgi:hypothetical protein